MPVFFISNISRKCHDVLRSAFQDFVFWIIGKKLWTTKSEGTIKILQIKGYFKWTLISSEHNSQSQKKS